MKLKYLSLQAVFRKILSATRDKMKKPVIKYESSRTNGNAGAEDEELERRKEHWKQELVGIGEEFLLMKPSQENLENKIDTAYIENKDGLPVLKATFDMKHFKREDIDVRIEDGHIVVEAQHTDDMDDRSYTKTMIRKVEVPKFADEKMMHCDLNSEGELIIELPFHLPPERKPKGPGVVPIYDAPDGRKKIRIVLKIGPEFTEEDINIETNGRRLKVTAGYNEELGRYGVQKTEREINKEYRLPEYLEVDEVITRLKEGILLVEVYLKPVEAFTCKMSAEDVPVSQS